jgi:hypothetical protein
MVDTMLVDMEALTEAVIIGMLGLITIMADTNIKQMRKAILLLSMLVSMSISNSAPVKHHPNLAVDSVYICVSKTGHKYHSDRDCRGLARCTHEVRKVSKEEAIKMGYSACKICY